jgi:GTP cyclohydrolase I
MIKEVYKENMKDLINSNDNKVRTDAEKQLIIDNATVIYGNYLTALGFDWENDPNMKETPNRVAKMHVRETFRGCYDAIPKITVFENVNKYDGIVFQGNIDVKSVCSHHHMPFLGKAHVAYIPAEGNGKIVGLSKLNRIVEYFARRPQVQENLTMPIHDYVNSLIPNNQGVAVIIEAEHTCVSVRGVQHDSVMKTSKLSGGFKNIQATRQEFYEFIRNLKK